MNQVETIKIAELIKTGEATLQTGPFGTQLKASDYVEEGMPVINVRNIGFGDIRQDNLEFLNEQMVEQLAIHKLEEEDIVFGRKGAVERHAFIKSIGIGWIQGSDCLRLRIRSDRIDNQFVSYYFKTIAHQNWMQAVCSFGATMASLNQDIVKLITIPIPPLQAQKKISAVLSAYDDLIENNKRRTALLEKMAEEIYREWFVRFRFPGWQEAEFEKGIPKGWEVKRLGDILELAYGKALKQEDRIDGNFPVFGSGGLIGFHNKAIVKEGGIIVGRKGNVGAVYWSDKPFFPIDTVYYVASSLSKYFLFYLLQRVNFVNNDAAVPGLNRSQAYSSQILLPKEELILSFEYAVKPLFEQKKLLLKSVKNLEVTKNALLQRLISGKLSVEELGVRFPPSMRCGND